MKEECFIVLKLAEKLKIKMLIILYSWNLSNRNSFALTLKLLNIPCTQLLVNHRLLFLDFHRIRATLLGYLIIDSNTKSRTKFTRISGTLNPV